MIEKRAPTDAFQSFLLFSGEHGVLRVMNRVARRTAAQQAVPDLFDEVSALLESSNQGRTWFVREARILKRREGIGRSYDALRHASALIAVIGRNPVHEESREDVAQLLRTALDAFAAADRPDIVYLKSLYLFARDEGYPVKQEWLPSLSEADRALASEALARPLGAHGLGSGEVERIRHSLEAYLASSTEIIIP